MADAACDYCLAITSFEAPHKGPCGVKDSIARGKQGRLLISSDLTDENFATRTDNELLRDFVDYGNHASHLRFAAQRWEGDAKKVYDYLKGDRKIDADERIFI